VVGRLLSVFASSITLNGYATWLEICTLKDRHTRGVSRTVLNDRIACAIRGVPVGKMLIAPFGLWHPGRGLDCQSAKRQSSRDVVKVPKRVPRDPDTR
jgi:hypothetical protein